MEGKRREEGKRGMKRRREGRKEVRRTIVVGREYLEASFGVIVPTLSYECVAVNRVVDRGAVTSSNLRIVLHSKMRQGEVPTRGTLRVRRTQRPILLECTLLRCFPADTVDDPAAQTETTSIEPCQPRH